MPQWFKSVVDALRKPEWIAAIVLFIQAVILFLQTKLLGRHAETMEEHTKIARVQAKTVESIRKALEQQGKILDEQTKIMQQQVKFQRRLEEKIERAKILDNLTDLHIAMSGLMDYLGKVSHYTHEVDVVVTEKQHRATDLVLDCMKELKSSIYITEAERAHFIGYVAEANNVPQCNADNFQECVATEKALESKYPDVIKTIFAAASTPL